MRFLRGICRIVFSLTFIISGLLKLFDPVGTGLIMKEYFAFMHLGFLDPAAVGLGIALSTVEFITGVSVLIGLKMNFFAPVALCLTGFFTLLTLYLAIFNPISDCGCFGQAIHLTNWQTFQKNLVLLALALLIFFSRHKATKIAPDAVQWVFVGLLTCLGLVVAVQSLIGLPQIDFTVYNVGRDLTYLDDDTVYETVFLYSKDGKQEEFTLDNLPDSTWTFVDSRTELKSGSPKLAQIDFILEKTEGRFFAASVYDLEKLSPQGWVRIENLRKQAMMMGEDFVIYAPVETEECRQADRKSLMTLNRSNGGLTYFYDGVIAGKWSSRKLETLDLEQIVQSDPDLMVLKRRVREQTYLCVIVVSLLALLLLVRYFCRMFSK